MKDRKVNEVDIRDLEITYEGNTYVPIKHGEVIDIIKNHLEENGFIIEKEEYLASKKGKQLIGKYYLTSENGEIKPMISFKNSLDGSMAFGIASGTSVFICGNGVVFGDAFSYKRRHTGDAKDEIRHHVKNACDCLPAMLEHHTWFIGRLKKCWLTIQEMEELCGRLFFNDILTSEQLNTVKNEFLKPTHDYGSPDTAWVLYNHCTFALKDAHPLRWHKQHKELSDFFSFDVLNCIYSDEEE